MFYNKFQLDFLLSFEAIHIKRRNDSFRIVYKVFQNIEFVREVVTIFKIKHIVVTEIGCGKVKKI